MATQETSAGDDDKLPDKNLDVAKACGEERCEETKGKAAMENLQLSVDDAEIKLRDNNVKECVEKGSPEIEAGKEGMATDDFQHIVDEADLKLRDNNKECGEEGSKQLREEISGRGTLELRIDDALKLPKNSTWNLHVKYRTFGETKITIKRDKSGVFSTSQNIYYNNVDASFMSVNLVITVKDGSKSLGDIEIPSEKLSDVIYEGLVTSVESLDEEFGYPNHLCGVFKIHLKFNKSEEENVGNGRKSSNSKQKPLFFSKGKK